MADIGIGIIGGGYMGKAHSVAMASVGAVFNTKLRPKLEMIAASTLENAKKYGNEFGFKKATGNWLELVNDSSVEPVIIAHLKTRIMKLQKQLCLWANPSSVKNHLLIQ